MSETVEVETRKLTLLVLDISFTETVAEAQAMHQLCELSTEVYTFSDLTK